MIFPSDAAGGGLADTADGDEVEPLADVRGADARRCKIGSPDGISERLQVSTYSGQPVSAIDARNLLSKEDCRAALGDELVKSGPEMALVGGTASAAG